MIDFGLCSVYTIDWFLLRWVPHSALSPRNLVARRDHAFERAYQETRILEIDLIF